MAEDCERTLLRRELIRELCERERSISELSELYGLSRKTIHSWKRRYEREGLKGLEPKSRRPHRSPREAISRQWKEAVLALKRRRRRHLSLLARANSQSTLGTGTRGNRSDHLNRSLRRSAVSPVVDRESVRGLGRGRHPQTNANKQSPKGYSQVQPG